MTWKEFKAVVDQQIAEQGADENIEMWYIDISASMFDRSTFETGVTTEVVRERTIAGEILPPVLAIY